MKRVVFLYGLWLVVIAAFLKGGIEYFNLIEPSFFLMIFFVVFGVFITSFSILIAIRERTANTFINTVVGSTVVKLVLNIAFIARIIYIDILNANANIILFLVLYLSYTLIEVILLMKIQQKE